MNVRSLFTAALCVLAMGLLASPSAHAIGEVTCETPEYITGTVIVPAGLYSGPIAVTFSKDGGVIEMVEIENRDPDLRLFECVTGTVTSLSTIGNATSTQ